MWILFLCSACPSGGCVILSVADSITSYDSVPVRTKLASPENSQSPISRSSSADVNSPNLGEICSTLLWMCSTHTHTHTSIHIQTDICIHMVILLNGINIHIHVCLTKCNICCLEELLSLSHRLAVMVMMMMDTYVDRQGAFSEWSGHMCHYTQNLQCWVVLLLLFFPLSGFYVALI